MNDMKRFLILVFMISIKISNAQSFQWVESIGGNDLTTINSIVVDTDGNVITTGEFWGTVDFDPGLGTTLLTADNLNDVFVQKLDQDGNLIWVRSFGGSSYDCGKDIDVDGDGNIYIAGDFRSTVDFNPGLGIFELTATGINDVFVQKLNSNGDFIWAKAINGTETAYVSDMVVNSNDNIFITGYFRGTYDFDPGPATFNHSSVGNSDIFIVKMETNADYVWSKIFGGIQNDQSNSISIDLDGNIYTAGYYESVVDFDPGIGIEEHTSNGGFDVFVQKLQSNGDLSWVSTFGGPGNDIGEKLAVDDINQVYLSGGFYQTVDFDPGPGTVFGSSLGSMDFYIQKLDENGNLVWVNTFGGTAFDPVSALILDDNSNVYTVGMFRNTVDFDPSPNIENVTSLGNADVFIQKLTNNGNLDWIKTIGGVDIDTGSSFFVKNNIMYATGRFWSTVDFDFSNGIEELTPTGGNEDAYILKMTTCDSDSTIDTQTSCSPYTWINDITYTSSNNTAIHTLSNISGCDSVVTLDLTINTLDPSINQLGEITLEANSSGLSYQWLDCNDSFSVISGENGQLFQAIENGNYAVQVTNNNCTDTSICMAINSVGLNFISDVDGIEIYPNPTTAMTKLSLSNEQAVTVILRNSLGQHLKTFNDIHGEISIDLSSFSKGFYFLQFETEGGCTLKRIIKQ